LPRGLFKSTKGAVYLANPVGMERVLEAGRLFHIHWLVEVAVQEGCLEIYLSSFPVSDGKKTTDEAESFKAKSRSKYFLVVESMYLGIPHGNKTSLELLN
jgi:hypothetical protein